MNLGRPALRRTCAAIGLGLLSQGAYAEDPAVGCFNVHAAPRESRIEIRSVALTGDASPPPTLETQNGFRVVPADPDENFIYRKAYWYRDHAQLIITFSDTGLHGIHMRLRANDRGFEGVIENFWESNPITTDTDKVILTRRPCAPVKPG